MMATPDSSPTTHLDVALSYAARGWHVLPCYVPDASQPGGCSCGAEECAQIGKHPSPTHGLKQASVNTRQVESWWTARPRANLAIRTGAVSGFIVFDLDPKHGGFKSLLALEEQYGPLPETLTSRTGSGGEHRLFRHPGFRVGNDATGKLARGVDIRGDGGYIVAPPSLHVSGNHYTWLNDAPIAELPAAWVALLPRPKERELLSVVPDQPSDDDGEYWLDQALLQAREGTRNNVGFWLSCQLRDCGMDEASAATILRRYASHQGGDYTENEAMHSLDSAYSQPARERAENQNARPLHVVSHGRYVDPSTGEVLKDEDDDDSDEGQGGTQSPGESELPSINVSNRRLRDIVSESIDALNPVESLFQRGGVLLRLKRDDTGRLITDPLSNDALRGMLERCANYVRFDSRKKRYLPAPPPLEVVRDLQALPDYSFRYLAGIVETPVIRTDGSILEMPGYDCQSRLLFEPAQGIALPAMPEYPSQDDACAAGAFLRSELFADFPFVGDADQAHAFAILLTPLLRDLIDGPTPLLIVDAPTPGSGKGLCLDVCCMPAFGPMVGNLGECGEDAEWRKQITSTLLESTRIIRLDNIARMLDSASLARALTSTIWEDRVLGGNRMARLPIRCTWTGTGNNVMATSEIARRIVSCRLEPAEEHPELRTGFRHRNLREWARLNRSLLLAKAFIMIRAWFVAGKPTGTHPTLGSYEAWSETIGGILQYAGIPGFLGNSDTTDPMDDEAAIWQEFIDLWSVTFKSAATTVKSLLDLAREAGFPFHSSDYGRAQMTELGIALRKQRGRIIGGLKICQKYNTDRKSMTWYLQRFSDQPALSSAPIAPRIDDNEGIKF